MTDPQRNIQVSFHRCEDDARYANRTENPFLAVRERRLAALIVHGLPRSGQILEIGCGEGANLYFLREARPDAFLIGLDFSPAKIDYLYRRCIANAAVCADAAALPFADHSFDLVFCRDVLHHVSWNRDGVIAEALRVTRPEGRVVVLESDGRKLINRLFQSLYPAERGLRDSTPITISALARRHGELRALVPVEASCLLRAFGFLLGLPRGTLSPIMQAMYFIISWYERMVMAVLPPQRWYYWMMEVHPHPQPQPSPKARNS
jgi:ubiquinone/menaquinone biosynthesis C-methylase UbiE